jgi:hypothetical protein
MAKIMGNPTVTPTNIPANIPANISVWQPNTVYKKGQWVFVRDDGNGFTLVTLYECSRDHISGDTFTLTDGWGGRSLKANIALNDYLGHSIHGTYAKKNELTAVEAVAKGRATGYVFDTKEDMDAWLANSINTEQLVLGDNLYIRAPDVPDYWWDGTQVQQLETQKVDLTEYMTSEEVKVYTGNKVLPKLEVWQPNTEYKVGQHVLATVKGLAPAAFSGIMRCIKEHTSGATFPQTSDPVYVEYVNDYWELSDAVNANTAAFASQASMAYNAMSDIQGNSIIDTYATKKELANTEAIAKGRATGYVFDSKADMTAWLADSANTANLVLGDNLYIKATDVPDYWWDGTNIQPLGAEKPDFSDYYTKNQIDSRLSDASFDLISSEQYYSLYQSGSLEAGKIYLVFEEE